MATTKSLIMDFTTELGKSAHITVTNPKDDLTAEQVGTAMDNIIAKNIFLTTGGDLNGKEGARIINREVTELTLG